MSEPWSIEGEARRLCGCSHCKAGRGSRDNCMTWYIATGIRAGIEKAREAANEVSFRAAQAVDALLK